MNNKIRKSPKVIPKSKDLTIPVKFDNGLLDTLRARHNSRFSRSEAFIDILCRMQPICNSSDKVTVEQPAVLVQDSDNAINPSTMVDEPALFSGKDFDDNKRTEESLDGSSSTPTEDFMNLHCISNYSQLAAAWHWNRQTVLTFLRSLESAGVILFEQKNKSVEIFI